MAAQNGTERFDFGKDLAKEHLVLASQLAGRLPESLKIDLDETLDQDEPDTPRSCLKGMISHANRAVVLRGGPEDYGALARYEQEYANHLPPEEAIPRYLGAIKMYTHAIDLDTTNPEFFSGRGKAYLNLAHVREYEKKRML